MNIKTTTSRTGFTLIELLVVISIMATLAGFTLMVIHGVVIQKYRSIARGELNQIELALESYHSQYGAYPPSNAAVYSPPQTNVWYPQLYYELCGVTNNGTAYWDLDHNVSISNVGNPSPVQQAFGVGGFVNCWRGSGDDQTPSKNFLRGLKQNRVASVTANTVPGVTVLVTSVGGPDSTYQPLGVQSANPFRYLNPGVNNPNSYDLWVELVISGKTNLICNWNSGTLINSGAP